MTGGGGLAAGRRTLRLRATLVLATALAAIALQLDRMSPGLAIAGVVAAPALWLVLRYPRPRGSRGDRTTAVHSAARIALLAGLALLLAGLASAYGGERRARIAALCEGQSATMGDWNLKLEAVMPVAGDGFTALRAEIVARRDDAPPMRLAADLREHLLASPAAGDGTSRSRLLSGDLVLRLAGFTPQTGCIALDAAWRPLTGLALIGAGLAALAAAAMALAAAGALGWRRAARGRIAMRREDRPLPGRQQQGGAAPHSPAPGLVTGGLLALCLAALAWLAWPGLLRPTADPGAAPFAGGGALVGARQSLLEGRPVNTNRWIVIADAMARRGRYADAAEILLGAVEADPRDPQAWLALGDALYAHAGGHLSPAAMLAYDRADRAGLAEGAPLPLTGLAMERSGRAEQAGMWWRRYLANPAASAPARAAVRARLGDLAP